MKMNETLQQKKQHLEKYLKEHAPLAVAYSGGVDSALLLKIALEILEKDQVVAIMAVGPMVPKSEANFASEFAKQMGCEMVVFQADVLGVEEFVANGPKRCYFCKKYLFTTILALAKEYGCTCVVDGTNADDVKDYRPGRQALKELDVKSPFLEAGLTKAEIRELSGYYGLSTAKKPAMACLATRIPTGTVITREKLQKIEAGEEILKSVGLKLYRLRLLGETGRIECLKEEIPIVENCWEELKSRLKQEGFKQIELNPDGYGCGNMNLIKADL